MEPAVLIEALLELARECEVAVRRIRPGAEAPPGLASGPALVRGKPWVVLVEGEPPSAQAAALASGLVRFAGPALDARYLPPAVRACLDEAAARKTR